MGTIVYQNLLKLLLDEQDYTLDELIELANTRYGFDRKRTMHEFEFNLMIINLIHKADPVIQELPDGKLHKVKDFHSNIEMMLGFIDKGPPDYFEARPGLKKFYEDLEKRYGQN